MDWLYKMVTSIFGEAIANSLLHGRRRGEEQKITPLAHYDAEGNPIGNNRVALPHLVEGYQPNARLVPKDAPAAVPLSRFRKQVMAALDGMGDVKETPAGKMDTRITPPTQQEEAVPGVDIRRA